MSNVVALALAEYRSTAPNTGPPTVRNGTDATDPERVRLVSVDPEIGVVAAIDVVSATSLVPCAAAVRHGPLTDGGLQRFLGQPSRLAAANGTRLSAVTLVTTPSTCSSSVQTHRRGGQRVRGPTLAAWRRPGWVARRRDSGTLTHGGVRPGTVV